MNSDRISLQTLFVVFLMALVLGLTNCAGDGGGSSSDDGTQDPPTDDSSVSDDDSSTQEISQSISQQGGTLSLTDDTGRVVATLTIPEGAVRENTTFVIRNEPSNYSRFSDYYYLEPAGVVFDKPVTVQINIDPILENSSLTKNDLIMYSLADSGEISPINGSTYDATSDMFVTVTSHFSGNVVGPYQPTAEDIAVFKELFGGLTPELLEDLNAVYDTYVEGNTRPLSQSSYLNGLANVETWCDAQPDLQLGGAWAGDYIVAGYQVFIYSQVVNFKTDPYSVVYFDQTNFSTRGEHTFPDQSYLMMNVQPRNVKIPAEDVEVQEIFDITIRQTVSEPRLSVSPTSEIRLDSGETVTISANLFFNYQPIDSTSWTSKGKQDEIIDFEIIRGPGSLSANSQQTNSNGDASVVFTADWNTSETEPEITEIRVSFHRGNVSLEKTVIVSEQRTSLVSHTYPFEGQTEVRLTENIMIWFKEAMDTTSDGKITVEPGIGSISASAVWTGGNKMLTITPSSELEDGTLYEVTIDKGASAVSGLELDVAYTFTFTTKGIRKPEILSMSPEAGTKDVPVNTTLVFTFSKAMDSSSTESAFSISPATTGSLTWQSPTRLSFIPDTDLDGGQLYTVNISDSAQDTENNNLDASYALSFETEILLPEESPQGVVFEDTDEDFNQISGQISVIPATSQADITHYLVYWGDSNRNKLGLIDEIQKADIDTTTITIAENSAIPKTARYILAYSANQAGEKPIPAATAIGDLGGDVEIEQKVYNSSDTLTEYTKLLYDSLGNQVRQETYNAVDTLLSYTQTDFVKNGEFYLPRLTARYSFDDTLQSFGIINFDSSGKYSGTESYNGTGQLDGVSIEMTDNVIVSKWYENGICRGHYIYSMTGGTFNYYFYSSSGSLTDYYDHDPSSLKTNHYDAAGNLKAYFITYYNDDGTANLLEHYDDAFADSNSTYKLVSKTTWEYEETAFSKSYLRTLHSGVFEDTGSAYIFLYFYESSITQSKTILNTNGQTIESWSIGNYYDSDGTNTGCGGNIVRTEYDSNNNKSFYRVYDCNDVLEEYTEYIRGPYIRYLKDLD